MRTIKTLLLALLLASALFAGDTQIVGAQQCNFNTPLPAWYPLPVAGSPAAACWVMVFLAPADADADRFHVTLRYQLGTTEKTQEQTISRAAPGLWWTAWTAMIFVLARGEETLLPITLVRVDVEELKLLQTTSKDF